MAKCFKCEKEIECAYIRNTDNKENDTWEMPSGAVSFEGGSNFGSTLYDSMVDGIYVEILVCDECLIAGKANLREYIIKRGRNIKEVVN